MLRSEISISPLTIAMSIRAIQMGEVVINSMSAIDIVRKAIQSSLALLPDSNHETKLFYRETIKDSTRYFSIAEAIFRSQYFPSKKYFKLSLEKGRSKEDVSYTRLFEDYHPGGGPQAVAETALKTGFPDFLNEEKLKWFHYEKESMNDLDGRPLYIIRFDQRPDVHKALETGKIYIDAGNYAIVKYEAENSPIGMPYVKDLTGIDKLFAELLHIDFKRKGWKKQVEFTLIDGKLFFEQCNRRV